ncbi:MAG: type IV pilus twitching motility protein PilT [Candidatus Omnitrophota bacterium]
MKIEDILKKGVEEWASDVHFVVGVPPSLRINGEIIFTELPPLTPEESKNLTYGILTKDQIKQFEETRELDFSFTLPDLGRFRVNVYKEKGAVESAFRVIGLKTKSLQELGLPPVVGELASKPRGMVLISGPAGMGKTTTMAAMIDFVNETTRSRIITIEDPIEYLHTHKKSVVIQREVGLSSGSDTKSFSAALIHALRQDPNIICIGEMRDLDTFSVALTAAETGHLVMGTIHTPGSIQTISRIADVFPPYQQQQVRIQLADTLVGVISQILLPKFNGEGRVLATEILVCTPAISHLIRENKLEQIATHIQTGAALGMHMMDESLKELYQTGVIDYDTALSKAQDVKSLQR